MSAQQPKPRRYVLMTSGLTASAAVIAFSVAAGAANTDDPGPLDETAQSQPYDDPEPPEAG